MVVTKASEDEIRASVEFLKWFTEAENNITFSVESGYLPVTKDANNMDKIKSVDSDLDDSMSEILTEAVAQVNNRTLYSMKVFPDGNSARSILETSMSDIAAADRETVLERISQGQSVEEAEADFLSDEYFEEWYKDILSKLQEYEG